MSDRPAVYWNGDEEKFFVTVPGLDEPVDITEPVMLLMADAWKNGSEAVRVTTELEYSNPYEVELAHDIVRD